MTTDTSTSSDELAFSFLRTSHRPSKPRTRGIAEIRGPYYTVSTGRFIEHVLTHGPEIVDRYVDEVARLGFDILEISAGFISIPSDDILRLVERVQRAGRKPEVGIQFGAGGATTPRSSSRRVRATSATRSTSRGAAWTRGRT